MSIQWGDEVGRVAFEGLRALTNCPTNVIRSEGALQWGNGTFQTAFEALRHT